MMTEFSLLRELSNPLSFRVNSSPKKQNKTGVGYKLESVD